MAQYMLVKYMLVKYCNEAMLHIAINKSSLNKICTNIQFRIAELPYTELWSLSIAETCCVTY